MTERSKSEDVSPKLCASLSKSDLTEYGTLALTSESELPSAGGSPVERANIPWEESAVSVMWARCSAVVADELRGWADEIERT